MNTEPTAKHAAFTVNGKSYRLLNLKTELKARSYQALLVILDDSIEDLVPLFAHGTNQQMTNLEILALVRTLIKKLIVGDKLFEALSYMYESETPLSFDEKVNDMKDLNMEQILEALSDFLSTIGGYLNAIGISSQVAKAE
jgi:hypothetical protein